MESDGHPGTATVLGLDSNPSEYVLDLDPEIDRLAKVRAEAGFPEFERYFLRLPIRHNLGLPDQPVKTTVAWTGVDGARYEQSVTVQDFEVTPFVRHRAKG